VVKSRACMRLLLPLLLCCIGADSASTAAAVATSSTQERVTDGHSAVEEHKPTHVERKEGVLDRKQEGKTVSFEDAKFTERQKQSVNAKAKDKAFPMMPGPRMPGMAFGSPMGSVMPGVPVPPVTDPMNNLIMNNVMLNNVLTNLVRNDMMKAHHPHHHHTPTVTYHAKISSHKKTKKIPAKKAKGKGKGKGKKGGKKSHFLEIFRDEEDDDSEGDELEDFDFSQLTNHHHHHHDNHHHHDDDGDHHHHHGHHGHHHHDDPYTRGGDIPFHGGQGMLNPMVGMMGGMQPLQPFLTAPMGPMMPLGAGIGGGPHVDKRGMVEVEYADSVPEQPIHAG